MYQYPEICQKKGCNEKIKKKGKIYCSREHAPLGHYFGPGSDWAKISPAPKYDEPKKTRAKFKGNRSGG